jgi:hypothetical protein
MIDSDPRQSGRPAEAVRMAAGISAWRKVDVALYLREAAVLVLAEDADSLVDGELYARCLPMLARPERPIYVQKGATVLSKLGQATSPFEEISDEELAVMAANHRCVLHF